MCVVLTYLYLGFGSISTGMHMWKSEDNQVFWSSACLRQTALYPFHFTSCFSWFLGIGTSVFAYVQQALCPLSSSQPCCFSFCSPRPSHFLSFFFSFPRQSFVFVFFLRQDWPDILYVTEVVFELKAVFLSQLPAVGITDMCHHIQLLVLFLKFIVSCSGNIRILL